MRRPLPLYSTLFTHGDKLRALYLSELTLLPPWKPYCLSFPTFVSIFFTEFGASRPPTPAPLLPAGASPPARSVPSGRGWREDAHRDRSPVVNPPFGRSSGWSRRGQPPPNADRSTPGAPTLGACGLELRALASRNVTWGLSSPCPSVRDWRPSRQVLDAKPRAAVHLGEGGEEWEGLDRERSLRQVWSQTLPPLPEGVSGERNGCNPQEGGLLLPLKATSFNQHLYWAPSVCPEIF